MLPKTCEMADLSDLQARHIFGPFVLHLLLGSDKHFPETMRSYRRNFVRLTDKAVREYMDVRRYVLQEIWEMQRPPAEMEEGRLIFSHLKTDRLEDCILTVRRLYRYFEAIRTDPSGFPLDRLLRQRIQRLEDSVRDVRNVIEHLDSDIREGNIQSGETTAPVLDETSSVISLAGETLRVDILAMAIRRFHEFAAEFAKYRLNPDGEYELIPPFGSVADL